ncbi:FAR1-related sequence 5-like protein [Tanacetum coccineum]
METDLELKIIDDNQLNEADLVVDAENNLVDTEIQEVDGLIVDIDEKENLVAATVPQTPRPSLYLHSKTPEGSVYWEPNVESTYLPIEGKVFDTIEECVDFYTYDMVFVPFTGIDNHRKRVTVGSGLLLREDTEAYTWLLRSFITAHKKQTTMIVTDQDGAMKLAIEEVLIESKHRLCMWHIMQKIPVKICKEIYDETDFKERFNKIVWNMFMEPMEFEEKWSKLIEDFRLQNHKWMTKMFNLREIWLPAYFIDSPLFGLMRTTSRSESENVFFKSFTNHGSTLVNFMMFFKSAMERQRYRQEVLRSLEDDSVECTCRHFLRYGFLCRHVFCVLKNRDIQVILEKYILRRWRRDIIPPALRRNTNIYGEKNETIENLTNVANFVVDECLFLLGKDEGMLAKFVEQLKTIKKEVQVQVPKPPSQKTGYVIEDIYAVEKPQQNNVNNPQRARRLTSTQSTCPSNPKYVAKLVRLAAATASEQGMTTATATKKATTTATAAEQGATTAAATEQASTTAIVSEEELTLL